MNVRRGLFRIWVVSSAVWVIAIGALTVSEIRAVDSYWMYADQRKAAAHQLEDCASLPQEDQPLCDQINRAVVLARAELNGLEADARSQRLYKGGLAAAIPPIALFVLGYIVAWVVRGFRSG